MCDGGAIVMAVLSIASTAYSINRAEDAADDQATAARKAAAIREEELTAQAGQQATERAQAARRERARLRAASAESGVIGLSIDEQLNNVNFALGTNQALGQMNLDNALRGNRAGLDSRLAGITGPDAVSEYVNAGLSIYGQNQTAINGYFNKPEATPSESRRATAPFPFGYGG
jgi:hypothetical protein